MIRSIRNAFTRTLIVTTAVTAAYALPALAQENQTQTTTKDEKAVQFLKQAARDNDLEIALAEVGARKAQNPELKSFSQQMQQDHTQANQQLRPIAQKYGVTIDQSLKKHQDRELTRLEKLNGQEFDRKFATEMLRSHEKAVNQYQKATQQVQAPDVKQYATTMLPQLEQHLQHAAQVAQTVGVDQRTISSILKRTPAAMGGTGEMPSGGNDVGAGTGTNTYHGAEKLQPKSPPGYSERLKQQ